MIEAYSKIPHRLMDRADLDYKEKLLAICLLRFDPCFVSYAKLSKMTGMSLSTVERRMPKLVKKLGIIAKKRKRGFLYDLRPITVTVTGVKMGLPSHRRDNTVTVRAVLPSQRRSNKNKEKEQTNKHSSDFSDRESVRKSMDRIRDKLGMDKRTKEMEKLYE